MGNQAGAPNGAGWREHVLLLGRFLRNPRRVGAIAPSSAALARVMVHGLNLGAARIVELGPGTGSLTSAIATRLGPAARMLAIDVDQGFIDRLRAQWPRIEYVCASAAALPELAAERGLTPVDHIISGLPFASLPGSVTREILDGVEHTLRAGGTFTTFQYVHAYPLPPAVAFRREISHRLGNGPHRRLVIRNFPPAFVLTWTRSLSR